MAPRLFESVFLEKGWVIEDNGQEIDSKDESDRVCYQGKCSLRKSNLTFERFYAEWRSPGVQRIGFLFGLVQQTLSNKGTKNSYYFSLAVFILNEKACLVSFIDVSPYTYQQMVLPLL